MAGWAVSRPAAGPDEIDASPRAFDAAPVPFWDAVTASYSDGVANQRLGARDQALSDAWRAREASIVQATGERPAMPVASMGWIGAQREVGPDYGQLLQHPEAQAQYEAEVNALRAKHGDAMAAIPTADQVRAQVDARLQALAAKAQTGAAQHPVASFLGGAGSQITDPTNLLVGAATGQLGEGAPLAMRMLAQSAVWGGLAAGEAPLKAMEAGRAGGPAYGLPEALGDVVGGAVSGPLFEAGGAALGALLKAAGRPVLKGFLASPAADATRGALDVLDQHLRDRWAIGPARSGADFDAAAAALATGAPRPPIEPSRDVGDLFGPPPVPGADARTAPVLAESPAGASLYEVSEYRGRQIYSGQFDPAALGTDAATFQYKSDSDERGVTDRLRGVQAWDPTSSGKVIVYQAADGTLTIADGHQRLGLANRLAAAGFEPRLDGYLFRVSDGWSQRDVRIIAALKNIREGQGNPLDAAKVLRDSPAAINDDSLPVSGDFIRQAKGLARLHPEAFGAIVNKVIPERYGALIGQLAGDRPDLHPGLVRLLKAGDPQNMDEAHALIREALEDEWVKQQGAQGDLFGESPAQSVAIGRAKLRAWLLKSLRTDGRLFGQLTKNADAIEAGGNILARDANEASLAVTNVALEAISRLGMRAGEMGDAMNAAAREIVAGGRVADAGKGILARVKAAIRAGERIDEGRSGLLNPAAPLPAEETGLSLFDSPGGKGQEAQIGEPAGGAEKPPLDPAGGKSPPIDHPKENAIGEMTPEWEAHLADAEAKGTEIRAAGGTPLFHATSGPRLDSNPSGLGMTFFAEDPYMAERYAGTAGGRRMVANAGRVEVRALPPGANLLDITTEEGLRVLADLSADGRISGIIVRDAHKDLAKGENMRAAHSFWSFTKSVEGSDAAGIKADIVDALRARGYDGMRFMDDRHPTVALFDDARAEPAGGEPSGNSGELPARGFTTAKGSTYTIGPNGSTIRDKSFHPEHGAEDVGVKPASDRTYYLTEEQADALAVIQGEGPRMAVVERNGELGLMYVEGKDAGKIERRTVVRPATEPTEGLMPFEIWNRDGRQVTHFGNKIISVDRGEGPHAAPTVDQADMGDLHPDLFADILGDEEHAAAEDHLRACQAGGA